MFDWFLLSDYFGVCVFSISGALAAGNRSMDTFGVLVIAFTTALGGGTLRDVMLGNTPVNWMSDPTYLILIAGSALLTMFGQHHSHRFHERIMLIADAIGLGVFTVIGVQVALNAGVSIPVAIMMGVITGAAGGVIRDVFCNEVPLIFRSEIYATASALGGALYCLLDRTEIPLLANILISMGSVCFIRILAVEANWRLPVFSLHKNSPDC